MKYGIGVITIAAMLSLTTGCSTISNMLGFGDDEEQDVKDVSQSESMLKPVQTNVDPVAPLILRVVGYGAINPKSKGMSDVQKRLMAIRASRLDAYRAMAERVYGTKLTGSSTVRDLVVKNDSFRTYVDTYIHGARVMSSDVMEDGSVETVLEMVIDAGFRNCLVTENSMRFNSDCRSKVMQNGTDSMRTSRFQNLNRIQSQSAIPETNHYFVD